MDSKSFLNKLAKEILAKHNDSLDSVTIVLPNKRARVFLLNEFRNITTKTFFSPKVVSIEELIQDISGINAVDNLELLFEFYEVYSQLTLKEEIQSFDAFANWAKIAIQDFNEIDRYLLDSDKVFEYLSEVKAIERWQVNIDEKSELVENYLQFWGKLPKYYTSFSSSLKKKKIGYKGLIYREAVKNLVNFSKINVDVNFIFAGFNALNQAEEKIINYFLEDNNNNIYWDIDHYFLQSEYHDVGMFIKQYKKNWNLYKRSSFEWITNDFQQNKNIKIIGTPKLIGQAKIVGKTIENLLFQGEKLDDCAIVLGDENLLLPILNSLPANAKNLNITMGYPSKNNPVQMLFYNLVKMHINASRRSGYSFYFKDVLTILNHPLLESFSNLNAIQHAIRTNNYTFFSFSTLLKLNGTSSNRENDIFELLFTPLENKTAEEILYCFKQLITHLKEQFENSGNTNSLTKVFLFAVFKILNQIETYQEKYKKIESLEMLFTIFKQLLDLSEVSFEGEPLTGLQIMGVLESRTLDFKNVIITSVNERLLPSGKSQQSFIPYDIKRALNLPTYKEKDAIYSYHFYHLLFRAENIFLIYNTDNEGMNSGEKSRYLQQLEIETLPNHSIENYLYNAVLPAKSHERLEIPKSDLLLDRLKEIATKKGFSPSSLTAYVRNPIKFYFQRVLKINEVDEVEESIAVNTLGTIIHDSLEKLYKPYLNKILTIECCNQMMLAVDDMIADNFKAIYKEGIIKKGKNYLAYEVAKRNVHNFLLQERISIEKGDTIKILNLEADLECEIFSSKLPYPIKIAGKVDRIEERNGKIRIVDYKTGKVEAKSLKIDTFEGLTSEIKHDKIIQLLCYALMYEKEIDANNKPLEVGIISFKNLKSGFLPFMFNKKEDIDGEVLSNFKEEIITLIGEILNPENNFIENSL